MARVAWPVGTPPRPKPWDKAPTPPPSLEPGPALAVVVLMGRLADLGIVWSFDGEALIVSAPGGVLTPGLERAITHHWEEMAIYAEHAEPGTVEACSSCGGGAFWEWTDRPGLHCVTCEPRHRTKAPPREYATLAHRDGRRFR